MTKMLLATKERFLFRGNYLSIERSVIGFLGALGVMNRLAFFRGYVDCSSSGCYNSFHLCEKDTEGGYHGVHKI